MSSRDDSHVERGSGTVFADLERPDMVRRSMLLPK